MDPHWRVHLHSPTPPTPLPQYLQSTVNAALTAISPSLFDDAPPSSILLIGSHASGKSLVTQYTLHHLQQAASDNSKTLTQLTLTGLLHSTPIRAWRHIASTLSSQSFSNAPLQQCLAAIAQIFSTFRTNRTPLLILLDHFERFVTTTDPMSQTVLYSLLNFLQDQHMRIACIANTTSIDVTDALEKRVKSRFLHRQLIVPLPETPTQVLDWLDQVLVTPTKTNYSAKLVSTFLQHPRCAEAVRKSMLRTRVVAPILHATDAALKAALHDPLPDRKIKTRVPHACDVFEKILNTRDATAEILCSLTALEIVLLMSLRKLSTRAEKRDDKVSITFSDVFKHYESATVEESFSTTKDADRLVERGVAEKCWERLVECGAVVRLGHGPREVRTCVLGVSGDDVDRALQDHKVASLVWKNWGKKR